MEFGRMRTRSLDDDDIFSRCSCGKYQSAFNSDSECGSAGICVRDMIRRYNSAAIGDLRVPDNPIKITCQNCRRQTVGAIPTPLSSHSNSDIIMEEEPKTCCKNCANCICCHNHASSHVKSNLPTGVGRGGGVVGGHPLDSKGKSMTLTEERSKLVPHGPERNQLPECVDFPSSYQSKTTIAKTSSGVRIIIDIFFDQQYNNIPDVIGNHVETNIPPSRILNEFQQQNLAASKQL